MNNPPGYLHQVQAMTCLCQPPNRKVQRSRISSARRVGANHKLLNSLLRCSTTNLQTMTSFPQICRIGSKARRLSAVKNLRNLFYPIPVPLNLPIGCRLLATNRNLNPMKPHRLCLNLQVMHPIGSAAWAVRRQQQHPPRLPVKRLMSPIGCRDLAAINLPKSRLRRKKTLPNLRICRIG